MGKFKQMDAVSVRICEQCHSEFVLGQDGVLVEHHALCDACAGVTRALPGGAVVELHPVPLAVGDAE